LKDTFKKLKQHPKYNAVLSWGKLISIIGIAQIILQFVGFASGILVIRLLPVQEYAFYTIANTMLGTMSILADGGISTGVMAQGGKVWQDKQKLGAVIATGLYLRRKFAIVSLIVSTPILIYILLHNGASWLMAVMIALSLIPAFYAALSDSLLEIVPRLHQSIVPLQKNQLVVSLGRLLLSAISLFIFPWTFVAILASGMPRIYGNIKLKKISKGFVDTEQKPDSVIRGDILKVVKRSLPTLIFFSFSGQITIWIISVFGKVTSIAQLGALGRIAILLTVFSVLIGTLVVPRFSRLENNISILLLRYTQVLFVCTFVMILFAGGIYMFSDTILWILGSQYNSLNFELFLIMISACLNLISGVAFSLYSSKGWVLSPFYSISKAILVIIIAIFAFDLSTLEGVLYLDILFAITAVLTDIIFGYYNILKLDSVRK
jgi:O-antigen/teichoic acid export membrane protein